LALRESRPRLLEFLELEHETLAPIIGGERDGDDLVVRRTPVRGRPLDSGPIPRTDAAALLLQAAAASAFFATRGFPLARPDFEAAVWDSGDGGARLWLTTAPASAAIAVPSAADASVAPAFVFERLFARGGRVRGEGARSFARSLALPSASSRRSEFWVAAVVRAFPELAAPAFAAVRQRCLGAAGPALPGPRPRSLSAWAAAILGGGGPPPFEAGGPA